MPWRLIAGLEQGYDGSTGAKMERDEAGSFPSRAGANQKKEPLQTAKHVLKSFEALSRNCILDSHPYIDRRDKSKVSFCLKHSFSRHWSLVAKSVMKHSRAACWWMSLSKFGIFFFHIRTHDSVRRQREGNTHASDKKEIDTTQDNEASTHFIYNTKLQSTYRAYIEHK